MPVLNSATHIKALRYNSNKFACTTFKNASSLLQAMLRQLIVTVMGNVDAGKTQLLDTIRNTAIVESEPGRITQCIGCSLIPESTIKKICAKLVERHKLQISIPGFVIIDTPGHASFTSLRKRGGNLADIAILVIDINEGIKPQTLECIEILKQYKTPFVIALNKIDLMQGWQTNNGLILLESIQSQNQKTLALFEQKLYEIVGRMAELGFNSERFDRVEDYTQQIAIIPTSAKTGEGIPELLMVMSGLSKRFLEESLRVNVNGPVKGTILEIKEEKGLGITADVIIYDGTLKQNDAIIIGSLGEPVVTKVKALLEPMPLAEMHDRRTKYKPVKKAVAATGVKVAGPDLDKVVAGMPLRGFLQNEIDNVKEEIKSEVKEVLIETDRQGVVIKADSLGSLEALIKLLKEKNIEIKKASIGRISKKDISDADANYENNPLQSAVLGFNVDTAPDVRVPPTVKTITSNIIYKLLEELEKWQIEMQMQIEAKEMEFLVRPCKIRLMKGYTFRQNNPAIVGVEILGGVLKTGTPLMKNDGAAITEVKGMQKEQENVDKAQKGQQLAVSMPNVTVGRQIHEGDVLYSSIPAEQFKKFKEFKKCLTEEEKNILREIAEIMRKQNPMWGV